MSKRNFFHKRKLQIQEKKLKANAARKQKPVTRNPLKETHLANNIVHNDVNIADLQKQISDLKEIVCTHVLKNKVNFADRPSALTQKKKAKERILPFVTTYHPAVNNLKQTLMEQWSLIQNQPLLKTIYLKPPIIAYKRGKSLKDIFVRSKI